VLKKECTTVACAEHEGSAFGILSNTWRIFQRPLDVSHDFAVVIVKACVVLYNFVKERDGISLKTL
jgi:hypothetical protein